MESFIDLDWEFSAPHWHDFLSEDAVASPTKNREPVRLNDTRGDVSPSECCPNRVTCKDPLQGKKTLVRLARFRSAFWLF